MRIVNNAMENKYQLFNSKENIVMKTVVGKIFASIISVNTQCELLTTDTGSDHRNWLKISQSIDSE